MIIQDFFLVFVFILYNWFSMCCSVLEPVPTSGPFKLSIISIKDCSNPSKPYMENPPVLFESRTNNGTLSGNITILKNTRNMKLKLRSFILRNGNWEPDLLIHNLDCHGMVLHFLCTAVTVKHDRRSCMYFKGSYVFENVDVNQLLHLWLSKVQYGHIIWRTETYSSAGTFYCKDFETMAEPA